jgi:hypothetical protein
MNPNPPDEQPPKERLNAIPSSKNSRSAAKRWFRIAVALGAAIFAFCFWSELDSRRAHTQAEVELREEFGASVGLASEEFSGQLQSALASLEARMQEGFAGVAEEFAEICFNSDGIIERSKGEAAAKQVLTDSLRSSVTELVTRSLEDFHASVSDAQDLLESRLLITTELSKSLNKLLERHSLSLQTYAPQPAVSDLRGGGLGKSLDEGFAWVPLVGDAYDLGKLVFGDPREKGIRTRARNFVHGEEAKWLAMVAELKKAVPDAAASEQDCRAAFKPREALKRLAVQ